ncbi:putative ubiquitin-like domain-containing CTD phosphatase 1 isoform X1 [Apostichopus japonicus]|uniref:Ubiquitin-like domain-containing CTD phosphatase 1 n=1 Tax=Stichopus japonicus TaxID=307972 RepID=A0A2G8LIS7_STIJA|nr:putative ubiquitin-like domain-containing CTD phosphatase 1 isoform X1 [Apostichopus japonicus]
MAAPLVKLVVKWSGNEYEISDLISTNTVKDLKNVIKLKTGVLPERQKLLGLKLKGKAPVDDVQLSELKIKPNMKIMMMGTCEETIAAANEKPEDIGEVIDDFDFEETEIQTNQREEFLKKVERRVKEYEIKVLNAPRPGKKLLVLDVDYTLFDHRSVAEHALQLMRPFLHEFLTAAYKHYDIVIWSATSMKWIEVKMRELGVSSHTDYKITFMVDSGACITVQTPKYGIIETKPLGVIWGKFESYTPENTIMFDDLRRNFLMNPQNGLKIRPFREAAKNRSHDTELLKLTKYLEAIAPLDDLSSLNHRHWERYLLDKRK